ncbi:MAG: hypothetical protein RR626_08840 [Anaerovoracaceae bacterium]
MNKQERFSFTALPQNLTELKALPSGDLQSPFAVAALTVAALCQYPKDSKASVEMLNFLKGPQPLSPYELQFLADRFRDKCYVPISYFEGASPQNNYTPTAPFSIIVSDNPYSYTQEGYALLYVQSSGADAPRPIKLRQKGTQWFLWEQHLLADIRIPKSADPWA